MPHPVAWQCPSCIEALSFIGLPLKPDGPLEGLRQSIRRRPCQNRHGEQSRADNSEAEEQESQLAGKWTQPLGGLRCRLNVGQAMRMEDRYLPASPGRDLGRLAGERLISPTPGYLTDGGEAQLFACNKKSHDFVRQIVTPVVLTRWSKSPKSNIIDRFGPDLPCDAPLVLASTAGLTSVGPRGPTPKDSMNVKR